MADFTAPSFSLGLDFDFDSDLPTHQTSPHSPLHPPPCSAPNDEDLGPLVPDSEPEPEPETETGPDPTLPVLKRLRRGPAPEPCFDSDDDIEEFSSQDDDVVQVHAHWSARPHSVCSSSKVSLNSCGVLTRHSSSNRRERKQKQDSDIPASVLMETGQNGLMFPKLTTTPLRKFQLLDSDSDDPLGKDVSADHKIDSCSKGATCNQSKPMTSFEQNGSARIEKGQSVSKFPKSTSPLRRFRLLDSDSDDQGEDVSAAHKMDSCSKDATCNQSKPVTSFEQNGSARMEKGQSVLMFPKSTMSPLRRFQLLDSDSDGPGGEDVSAAHKIDLSSKDAKCNQSKPVTSFKQNGFARMEKGQSVSMFPKSTTSPLQSFQLLDSDSDDPGGEDVSAAHKIDPCSKDATCNQSKSVNSSKKNKKVSFNMNCEQDLWKDFSPLKGFSMPTPAFNEECEEYFHSAKDKEVEKSSIDMSKSNNEKHFRVNSTCQRDQQISESVDPLPPAHCYFFHKDPRIQQLVCSRLCNFSPLDVNGVNQQHNVSHIDYMGQFGNTGASKAQGVQKIFVNSSIRGKNKSRNLTVEETLDASGGWVDPKIISPFSTGESSRKKATKRNSTKNSLSKGKSKTDKSTSSNVFNASASWVEPKSCANMPKDAGKRRIQASGQSSGHWYTSSDGRKVYVNKNGQELTGRTAYRQYRKESGAGFKKLRGKTNVKKRN